MVIIPGIETVTTYFLITMNDTGYPAGMKDGKYDACEYIRCKEFDFRECLSSLWPFLIEKITKAVHLTCLL
jgi:hypothetical protein